MEIVQISAQESRRKKKEYVDALERKVECLVDENVMFRGKLDMLATANTELQDQIVTLQNILDLPGAGGDIHQVLEVEREIYLNKRSVPRELRGCRLGVGLLYELPGGMDETGKRRNIN